MDKFGKYLNLMDQMRLTNLVHPSIQYVRMEKKIIRQLVYTNAAGRAAWPHLALWTVLNKQKLIIDEEEREEKDKRD